MLCVALSVILCLLVRGGTGQYQEVQPSFCPSSQLVGAQCDDTTMASTPAPDTLESQVHTLRCHSGCLASAELNILDGYPVNEDVWTSINPAMLEKTDADKFDECRRPCLIYGVLNPALLPTFTEAACQVSCTGIEFEDACRFGCTLGFRISAGTADDPDQVPAQPTGTPPIFFEIQSSMPWEFGLNLSAVVPESNTQLQPNESNPMNGASTPVIHGFVLQIIIEENGVNTTYYDYMLDPIVSGSPTLPAFLDSLRCHEMYLSIAVVNFYGLTNLTEPTRTCIPGPYSLTMEPTLQLSSTIVNQGPPDNPSLGSITLNWQPPVFSPIFGFPTYEVSASYIKASDDELNLRCQPNGGSEEFRQRNLSDNITSFVIESGPHGNIQLLPLDTDPCMYNVTLEALWVGPNVTIPFLQIFHRVFPRVVDIVFVPEDEPFVRVTAILTNVTSDGFYNFDTIEAQLDPPDLDFFESFNAINWMVQLFDGGRGQFSDELSPVLEPNPMNFSSTNFRFAPPEEIRNVNLSSLEQDSFYQLTVSLLRVPSDSFPVVRRDYLSLPNAGMVQIGSSMARPIPPGPLRNVTITGCSIDSVMGNTSLQVAWELPEMSFGMLVNCSFNISVMEEASENTTLSFIPGTSQSPETRNNSFPLYPLLSQIPDSNYLFNVAVMCDNIHHLSTNLSTSNSFNGSECVLVEPPTPSPSPSPSSSSSVTSPAPTTTLPPRPQPTEFRTEYFIAIGAAVGLSVAALLLVILIGCYCVWCNRRKQNKVQLWEMKRTRSILRKVRATSIDDWEIDPNHLFMKEKLGEGNFGEVYQAVVAEEVGCVKAKKYVDEMTKLTGTPTTCNVAVKLLKTNAPGETRQSFLNEINMMKKVACGNSFNVVRMVGCVSVQSPYALVLEYVPYGSLLDYLRENRKLTQKRRQLKRMMQLAKETSRKKSHQLNDGGEGGAASVGAAVLPAIEEGSLHSLDTASAHYLSHSELNPGSSSNDSCFTHSAPEGGRKSPVLLEYVGDRAEGNDYLGVGHLDEARVSPYEEPVQLGFYPDKSDLGHGRPASYIQPISSPTQLLPAAIGSQKSDDSEPLALLLEASGHQKTPSSSAMNPLYEDPEIKNPYPDLGELEAVNLMMFAHQIASGMEYLASLGIVHRDLACRNVLVDRDKILKISDFGLSRETDLYVSSSQGRLPLRWMSPEAILDRVFTEKSDVWAYGITIWEICTLGGYPYATTPNSELLQSLLEGYRMERPDNCSEQIYRIMIDCWHIEAEERPLFEQLKSDLDKLLMVHQPDECIKFSEIDDEKLPYYKRGASNSEHSGGSNEDDALLNVPKLLNRYTPTATMRSAGSASCEATTTTTEIVVPAEVVRIGNGGTPRLIPISPQSSAGTIKDDDETQKNDHGDELSAEPSDTALTAQSSASTIRDDSGTEETKL